LNAFLLCDVETTVGARRCSAKERKDGREIIQELRGNFGEQEGREERRRKRKRRKEEEEKGFMDGSRAKIR